ncbi:hypothetical protein SDC9_170027 [bioreactor metagenome]|uniref:Uncharacterized protein n=1 Tax=bioreactor metagenome TaxID=1076179 RepID=A0A645GF93_9ZZZZ
MSRGDFVDVALPEDPVFLAVVRTFEVGVILHQTDNRNIHHLCHFDGFPHNHGNQFLRGGDYQDAVNRNGLEDSERNISGSRRHVDEHEIHILPDDFRPELLDRIGQNRTAPQHGICLVFQQQVDRHDVNLCFGSNGKQAILIGFRLSSDAEGFGDRRTRNIRIQNCGMIPPPIHFHRHQRGHQRFADATFAANDSNHLFHPTHDMRLFQEILRAGLTLRTGFPASGTVLVTCFTHRFLLL